MALARIHGLADFLHTAKPLTGLGDRQEDLT
jgi:hypothetical protein